MRRLTVLLAMAALAALLGAAPASANNDPHREFFPSGPMDLDDTFCAFGVHLDVLANREYGKTTQDADGSTRIHVTGSLVIELTRIGSDRSITVNAGGPGTFVYSPDGMTMTVYFFGRSLIFSPNLHELGYPSNVIAFAGPFGITQDLDDPTYSFTSVFGHPAIITDVCAALS
jgi:hypothetical protein